MTKSVPHMRSRINKSMFQDIMSMTFKRLNPFYLQKNPVMFVVFIGGSLTSLICLRDLLYSIPFHEPLWFTASISFWLWFTLLFANGAEAIAEGKGKAHASSLKALAKEIKAHRILKNGQEEIVPASELRRDDIVKVQAGEFIPSDGEIIEGIAAIDESAITGESAPVIRESDSDRSSVTAGTRVISNSLLVRIIANPGESFLDQMIHLVQAAKRQKTPNEIALQILLVGLTLIFLIVCATLIPFGLYFHDKISLTVTIALLVCLIPTTIGGLVSAIGISGIERALRKNILAMSGKAVETAGDVDVLLLDKTGTITLGNRMPVEFIPFEGVDIKELAKVVQLSSFADRTPEGKSIIEFVQKNYGNFIDEKDIANLTFIPFSAETRMSGCDNKSLSVRKGSCDAIQDFIEKKGGKRPSNFAQVTEQIGLEGGTPLAVAQNDKILGIIHLKDIIKPGIHERFKRLRAMGVRTVMITGDNPFTAQTIAEEVGVDTFLAEATPEKKMKLIMEEQAKGYLVAMTGDGTNDAPALAQADLGIAMNSGTQAAKEAANMVDLDSNPTKILEVIEIGKQLLMTRGCLTTFSIANDVAKYFAIIPAIFVLSLPELEALNIMHLVSPHSAVLSAVIFNALIIVILIPLALRGVKYRPLGAKSLLARSLLIYGVGGILVPFIGIKLIDMLLVNMSLI
ncbi:MAG: potassium-transporting ATPase subunit B [Alphaproteobacteria bacterium 41-28]|nr:MAG: potassium-transporting ATPase subunit B [Alphaproteobacteria bacterium 41-28]